jgi:hypothetical protein
VIESYLQVCNLFFFFYDFRSIFTRFCVLEIWEVFLRFLLWSWVLERTSSSTSILGVNSWLEPHESHGFLSVFPKSSSSSSSKIEREILGLGKNLFWELVPGVEVTLVPKFHSIWSTIAQELSFGRKGRILRRKICSRDLLPGFIRPYRTLSKNPRLRMKILDIVWLGLLARCSFTVLAISW